MIKTIFKIQCWFKFIVDTIIIQSCGINWGKQQTQNKLQNSKQIKENKLIFKTAFYMGTSSSKVVGLIKGKHPIILTTNYTIQTKYRK
jgi:hypothetical protein